MAEAVKKLMTPKFRALFVFVLRAKAQKQAEGEPEKKPKYSVLKMFPAGTDLKLLKEAAYQAAVAKWGADAENKLKHPKFKSPFKDGASMVDDQGKPYEGVSPGCVCIEAWSYTAPGIVGPNIDPATGKVEVLTAEQDIYSGMWARATVRPYGWTNPKGGFGITFDLQNLQKLGDDKRLSGGRAPAEDDFEAIAPPTEGGTDMPPAGAASFFD